MKRLGLRNAFVSTEENAEAGTKPSQTTEPQLFYIVCYGLIFFVFLFESVIENLLNIFRWSFLIFDYTIWHYFPFSF